jgi:hypothetical protein
MIIQWPMKGKRRVINNRRKKHKMNPLCIDRPSVFGLVMALR